jgi:hypothetical protein
MAFYITKTSAIDGQSTLYYETDGHWVEDINIKATWETEAEAQAELQRLAVPTLRVGGVAQPRPAVKGTIVEE